MLVLLSQGDFLTRRLNKMHGIFKFLSFVAIYYILISFVDIYGTIKEYRRHVKDTVNQESGLQDPKELKFDFNTDILVVCVIYLFSYYLGVFA